MYGEAGKQGMIGLTHQQQHWVLASSHECAPCCQQVVSLHALAEHAVYCCVLAIQPIKIETSSGKVEMAIMHAAELEQTTQTDQRCVAMLQRFPMHAMLFSSTGRLVHGNQAATTKLHNALEGTA